MSARTAGRLLTWLGWAALCAGGVLAAVGCEGCRHGVGGLEGGGGDAASGDS